MKKISRVFSVFSVVIILTTCTYAQNRNDSQPDKIPTQYIEPTSQVEFILVKASCFQMGDVLSEGLSNEKPVHEVCLDDFYLGKYEVTQNQWRDLMGDNPSFFKQVLKNPVERVSWDNIQSFLLKLNSQTTEEYRLPTEAEWEYACREGGKQIRFGNGKDVIDPYEANFDGSLSNKLPYANPGVSRKETTEVGTFEPNGLGFYDMSGNVSEWTQDFYEIYQKMSLDNPTGPEKGENKVIRGGSWVDEPKNVRCSSRGFYSPSSYDLTTGFRLARSVHPPRPRIYPDIENISYVNTIDGSTIIVDISDYPEIIGKSITVDINGISTPEIEGECSEEKTLAQKVKQRVHEILSNAKNIDLRYVDRGNDFKISADVWVDGRDLGQILLREKLAIPSESIKSSGWCKSN